jgi:hypothetical protein
MQPKQPSNFLQIKVSLNFIQPIIWRKILVSDKITLLDLHDVIQAVFDWQDYHLHEFEINHIVYGDPANGEFDFPVLNEEVMTLKKLNLTQCSRFTYVYDFGDHWKHTLIVEKVLPIERGIKLPRCVDGKRARPPEDVGGISGYAEFLKILCDPQNEEYESYLEWVGGAFDPKVFDLKGANERLQQLIQKNQEWNFRQEFRMEEKAGWVEPHLALTHWLELLDAEDETLANGLPLRRDVVSLLRYLKDLKIIGTQSTGNLPQKVVQELAAQLVDPPQLELKCGEMTIEFKNEGDVWPIYFVHLLAFWADLIDGGRGQCWKLSPDGEQYLTSPVVEQFYILFTGWWFRGDWLNAPMDIQVIDELPMGFSKIVQSSLLEISSSQSVEFTTFANRIIELVGWKLPQRNADFIRSELLSAIESMVILPLEAFCVLSTKRVKPKSRFADPELKSIQLTEMGQKLLRSLRTESTKES